MERLWAGWIEIFALTLLPLAWQAPGEDGKDIRRAKQADGDETEEFGERSYRGEHLFSRSPRACSQATFLLLVKMSLRLYFGLILHFPSYTDKHYKYSLLKTMLHRAYALSSTTEGNAPSCAPIFAVLITRGVL